jgi:hypothetical protein
MTLDRVRELLGVQLRFGCGDKPEAVRLLPGQVQRALGRKTVDVRSRN